VRSAEGATSRRRRRLTVQERRDELLQLGLEVFGRQSYEEVSVEDVAARAGISTGLLYHYFPSKKDYFLEVLRLAVSQIYRATTPASSAAPEATLLAAIEGYLAHAADHPMGFLTTHRSALTPDPDVQRIISQARQRQLRRILALIDIDDESAGLVQLAVLGWMAMVYEVTATWVTTRTANRESIANILTAALLAAVRTTTTSTGPDC
jgi:AcrR family transcriptional regulator